MDLRRFQQLFEYNRWANARTRDALRALAPEQFAREIGGSYGTLRNTVAHLISSEWVWLRRWQGASPDAPPFAPDSVTVENVAALWQPIETDTQAFVEGLTPAKLDEVIAYRNTRGQPFSEPLWQQLEHVVNHSSYHRGQIVTLIRQVGAEPAGTDLIAFYRGRGR